MIRVACLCALLAGCLYGGGPTLGIGLDHGQVSWGVEATAGTAIAEGATGFTSRGNHVYLRGDVGYDPVGFQLTDNARNESVPGGWIGGGVALDEPSGFGMFQAGGDVGWLVESSAPCETWSNVILVSIGLRYLAEWSLVISPRSERHYSTCGGGH